MHDQDRTMLSAFATYQRARNLADTTLRNRHSIITAVTKYAPLTEVTTHHLREHLGRAGISAGTRVTERNALIAFFTFCHAEGLRADDPTLRLDRIRAPRGTPRPFTFDQIERMLTSGAYFRTRAMILLGYYQGFRVSQIARVRGDDIDTLSATIRTLSKGGKPGTLPLHPVIAQLAKAMPPEWWFPARKGGDKPIRPSSVTDLITKAKKRAGITDPRLTPHSLRHSFGTDLVEAGVDVRVVQTLMMHESLSTTQIYTQVSEQRRRDGLHALPTMHPPERSGRPSTVAA